MKCSKKKIADLGGGAIVQSVRIWLELRRSTHISYLTLDVQTAGGGYTGAASTRAREAA